MFKRFAIIIVLMCLPACGKSNSPTSPSVLDITGKWAGPMMAAGSTIATVTASLVQTGTAVSGTYVAKATGQEDLDGTVSGSISNGLFTGTMVIVPVSGCAASNITISGSVTTTTMTWQNILQSGAGACEVGAFTITLTKQ